MLLQVQVRGEPKDWKLIETANFNLYYPSEELLPRAREFAGWFERARVELVATMGVEPPRINVFLYKSFHDLQMSSYLGSPKTKPLADRIRAPALRERPPELECPCLHRAMSPNGFCQDHARSVCSRFAVAHLHSM